MATLQIDKLLETVVREGISDLHLTTKQPPVVRLDGRMVKLETKTLDADDMVGLMKSITPERNQQELQEVGGTDFGFAFGDKARSREIAAACVAGRLSLPSTGWLSAVDAVRHRESAGSKLREPACATPAHAPSSACSAST